MAMKTGFTEQKLLSQAFREIRMPSRHSSFFFCWSYLRFYYRFDEGVGDKAEEFAFIYMFPQITHLFLTPLSTAFYNICAVDGVYPPLEAADRRMSHHLRNMSSDSPALEIEAASSSVKHDEVAERRRAKAMKMLDAKMAELSRKSEGWDDDHSPIESGNNSDLGKFRV